MSIAEVSGRLIATTRTLENGLTVVVREDHSANVAAIVTYVNAGYFDEADRWAGISHVLEHMYFKGTPTRGPGVIAQETKDAGGYLNASTIYDHTSYYTVVPASSFLEGLDLQADALINSHIDEQELAKELEVIIQEAKRKLDNPAAVAREGAFELLFDEHRIRRWRIGTEAGLRQLRRQDVVDFFHGWYRGSSIVLAIVGAVDSEHVFEAVADRYNKLRGGDVDRDRGPREPERSGFRFRDMSGDVTQSRIEIVWRTQPTVHADTPALDLLATVLGQGRASRLYREVRERGLVSGVSAHNYTPTELGVFSISAEAEPHETMTALRAIFETVRNVTESVTEEEVSRAQSIMEARMLRSLETMEGQANFLAEWQSAGDWQLGLRYVDDLLALRTDDLVRVARHYLTTDRAAVVVYRPSAASPLATSADELRAMLES